MTGLSLNNQLSDVFLWLRMIKMRDPTILGKVSIARRTRLNKTRLSLKTRVQRQAGRNRASASPWWPTSIKETISLLSLHSCVLEVGEIWVTRYKSLSEYLTKISIYRKVKLKLLKRHLFLLRGTNLEIPVLKCSLFQIQE